MILLYAATFGSWGIPGIDFSEPVHLGDTILAILPFAVWLSVGALVNRDLANEHSGDNASK